jgi:hypothetical protein
VADSCEHGNEPSDSIKCGEFIDKLSVLLFASQKRLCSMLFGISSSYELFYLLFAKTSRTVGESYVNICDVVGK